MMQVVLSTGSNQSRTMRTFLTIVTILFSYVSLKAQTTRINFTADQFYPEGIAYNSKQNLFYIGSVKTGTIATVNSAGKFTEWHVDPALKSSFGMKVDSGRNILWVCTGDPNYSIYSDSSTFKKIIRLIGLDLNTGKKVKDYNLSALYNGRHFPNDLAVDREGNIYLTDSYSPVIYKVDNNGTAEVFADNEKFGSLGIGLNGIAWHPDGFLVVVNNGTGALFKIQVKDPRNIQRILTKSFFPGGDGLLFNNNQQLILVQNKGVNKIFVLNSNDNWNSAEIEMATAAEDRFHQPSTCTIKGGKVYVVNSKLNELQDKSVTPSKDFSLQVAEFSRAK